MWIGSSYPIGWCLAEKAKLLGYRILVLGADTGRAREITAVGIDFIPMSIDRSGTNPIKEITTLFSYFKAFKKLKPDVIHHITLKPVVYGSIAARLLNIPVINAVSGLGYNLSEENSGLAKRIMVKLMQWGFGHKRVQLIFQNKDDQRALEALGIVKEHHKITMIKGAGVDLKEYYYSEPVPKDKLEVMLPARMLWDKGIQEFKDASIHLMDQWKGSVLFRLIGVADQENKAGINEQSLKDWIIEGYFEWTPYQTDMVSWYQQADIVALPSYREGMPKSLLEACAIGRPIVTTDAIGCKECVDEGINGYKVPVRDALNLADAIESLLKDKSKRIEMGLNSRKKAVKEFDVESVVKTHMELYHKMTNL